MIKVVFFLRDSERRKELKARLNKRGDDFNMQHVELHIDDNVITWDDHKPTYPIEEYSFYPKLTPKEAIVLELPISAQWVLDRRKKLGRVRPTYTKDWIRITYDGHNPLCINPIGGLFTCANMAAYLLGFEDYWAMDSDDVYECIIRQADWA